MKKLLFVFALTTFLFTSLSAGAQDVIVRKEGSTVLGKVEEIAQQYVKYRKWENPDGPVYVMDAALVDSIKFGNGTVEVFRFHTDDSRRKAYADIEDIASGRAVVTVRDITDITKQQQNLDLLKRVDMLQRARRYNIIAAECFVAGTAIVTLMVINYDALSTWKFVTGLAIGAAGIVSGACLIDKASNLRKEALSIATTSPLVELPITDNAYAGVCVMSNSCTHSSNLGVGLSFRF